MKASSTDDSRFRARDPQSDIASLVEINRITKRSSLVKQVTVIAIAARLTDFER